MTLGLGMTLGLRMRPGVRLGLALLMVAAPLDGASKGEAPLSAPSPTTPEERDARIHELETAIAEQEEALRVLIRAEPTEGDDPLITSDEMREVANRLPELQDELRGLVRAREIAAAREKRARELQSDPQTP